MKKIIVSIAALAVLSSASYATDLLAGGGPSANKQTGCGLGSIVFKKKPETAVLFAFQATLNVTGSQTFGISSGTSGCKKTQFVMNERVQDFVASNMDQLAKEIAIGHGESVDTVAELLSIEDKEAFAATLQYNYNNIYTSQNAQMADVLDNISAI